MDFGVDYENHENHPAHGKIILHPRGINEREILRAYGGVDFFLKMGQLVANHFVALQIVWIV